MSHVTNIILITVIEDGAQKDGEHPNVDRLNLHFQKEGHANGIKMN